MATGPVQAPGLGSDRPYARQVRQRVDSWQTPRLLMRRWQVSDRAPFAALNNDQEVMRYFPSTRTRKQSDASIDRFEQHFDDVGFGLWALELQETGQFIGFTGLDQLPDGVPGTGGVEVGWRLARAAWGHGYATEAALGSIDAAFSVFTMPEVWSMTAVLNTPSQAVMRRIGMTFHSKFEHPHVPVGHKLRPHLMYCLDRYAYQHSTEG